MKKKYNIELEIIGNSEEDIKYTLENICTRISMDNNVDNYSVIEKKEENSPILKLRLSEIEKEKLDEFLKIVEEVEKDSKSNKRMEERQRKYGTLTSEEKQRQFTI